LSQTGKSPTLSSLPMVPGDHDGNRPCRYGCRDCARRSTLLAGAAWGLASIGWNPAPSWSLRVSAARSQPVLWALVK
jgi:hypothetical protein